MSFAEIRTVSYRLSGARPDLLNDLPTVRQALRDSAQAAGLYVLSCAHRTFTPRGVSLAPILSVSHLAAHTWPEAGGAHVTATSCSPASKEAVTAVAGVLTRALDTHDAQEVTSTVVLL